MQTMRYMILVACVAAAACGRDEAADGAATTADSVANATVPMSIDSAAVTSTDNGAGGASPSTATPTAAPSNSAANRPAAPPVAETDAENDAAKLLTRTAARYRAVSSMKADFTMRVENPLLRSSATTRGKLYQKRPDRIALRFTDPDGDVILSDGTYFWAYTPSSIKGQAIRTPASEAGANSVDLQAQFVGDPVKRFTWTVDGDETVAGHPARVMTLTPREPLPYRTLKVWIDTDDALVRRFEITENSGVIRRIDLASLQTNVAIDPSVFVFTPPAGVRVTGQAP